MRVECAASWVAGLLLRRAGQSRLRVPRTSSHRAKPVSGAICLVDGTTPTHRAPCPRRHGAGGRSLLDGDSYRGGQSVEWSFDNFGHGWLEDHVPMDKKVLLDWLKAGYVESGKLFPTEAGTPQGGIASPTIANIALDGLETVLAERFGRTRSVVKRLRVRLVRYCDDFIITGNTKKKKENEVKPCGEIFLAERGLE